MTQRRIPWNSAVSPSTSGLFKPSLFFSSGTLFRYPYITEQKSLDVTQEKYKSERDEDLKVFMGRVLTLLGDIMKEVSLQHKFLRSHLQVPDGTARYDSEEFDSEEFEE